MDFIQSILPAIEHFSTIGYWVAFLVAFFETIIGIGFIIPGTTIILFMGALAAEGYFDLGDLIWFAVIGAIIGDNINYLIGRKYGSKILKNGFWFIKNTHFKKGEEFFKKHGSKSVFIGRFIPTVKEIAPTIAGIFGMKRFSFMLWNMLGAIGWALVWILPGYFFAQSLDVAKIWLTRTGFLLVVLLIVFAVFYILKVIFIKKGKEFFSLLSSIWQSLKKTIAENQEVKKFAKQHKKFFSFLQRRVDKNNFYGLPLTLLLISLIYVLGLLGGIVEDIVNSDIIVSVDTRVANLLAIFRSDELTTVFSWITLLGKWQTILIFATATILILWLWKKRSYITPLLFSIIGSEVFTFIGKTVFHRTRPETAIYTESSFSFPSGHATIAIAFYGFLSYVLIRSTQKWKYKINIFFTSFITILLIGFSRLYLGVHYVSDVWGGYLVGTIWLIIAISLSEYLLSKKQSKEIVPLNFKKQITILGIIVISILSYIVFASYYQMPVALKPKEINKIVVSSPLDIFISDQFKYTETLLGERQEPLSFIVIAKDDQRLIEVFKKAGWILADRVDITSTYEIAKKALLKESYPKAPMTPDFWNSEVHNFGFEKETVTKNVRTRHHTRFWKTNYVTKSGENIYVGTASFDGSIKWGVVHKIDPNIDAEREILFNDLQNTELLSKTEKHQLVNPKLGSNFSGDLFFTDGKLYLLFVK